MFGLTPRPEIVWPTANTPELTAVTLRTFELLAMLPVNDTPMLPVMMLPMLPVIPPEGAIDPVMRFGNPLPNTAPHILLPVLFSAWKRQTTGLPYVFPRC